MKKIISVLLLVLIPFCYLFAQDNLTPKSTSLIKLDRIVAIVNNDVITQSQFTTEINQIRQQMEHSHIPIPSDKILRQKVMDQLIARCLQSQMSKTRHIQVTEADVEKALQVIAAKNHLTQDQFKEAAKNAGIDFTEFRTRLKEQITFQRLQQQELGKSITLSDKEVLEFMKQNHELRRYAAVHLQDFYVPLTPNPTPQQIHIATQKVLHYVHDLQKDSAKQVTTDQVAQNDLGWRSWEEVPALFAAKIVKLPIGGITEAIHAPNGVHVLKLLEARGDKLILTKQDAQNMLYQRKMEKAVEDWITTLRANAYIKIMN